MAGPIPEEILAEILRRANIVEVVGEHLSLRKVGSGYQGLCPFHTDSKPSFHVNEAKQFFHCFGCGTGGNAFHFLMRLHNMSFPEAVRSLATKYGVALPERSLGPQERRQKEEREILLEINEIAVAFFRGVLEAPDGERARRYLKQRGISSDVQKDFDIGFAPAGWRGLVDHLRQRSTSLRLAERAGLVIPGKEGGYYDRFRERVIFPIHDEGGRVIGFGGRGLGDELPKYINTPESPIFAKRRSLYGLYRARGAIRDENAVVVVEGYTDLLALHQFGVRHAVATLGTALTVDHLRVLRRFSPHVVHVFDADEAGERATLRAVDLSLEAGVWGRVLRLPKDQDPDTYVRAEGAEVFRQEVERAIPLMDFWIERVLSGQDVSRLEGRIQALEQILPRIRRLPSRVAVDHYVAFTAGRLDIAEGRIREMLRDGAKALRERVAEASPEDPHRAERLLLQSVLKEPSLGTCLQEGILEEFQGSETRALGEQLAQWAEGGEREIQTLEARIQQPALAQVLAGLLARLDEVADPERVCEDCLRHLRRKGLERKLQTLEGQLAKARSQRDEGRIRVLEKEKIDLVVQKARLRMSASSYP